jgi:choloylglycine hydrolase
MKMKMRLAFNLVIGTIVLGYLASAYHVHACSTVMLAKGAHLVFGHNLNENGIDIPGLVFINKRGVFKTGRTWSEMINKERSNPSALTWISRYGSVTFNVFGRDFPDGGMNESGLYIWEMNETADFPKNKNLPKLMHMNWMQYNLDNHSTLDEVIDSAGAIEIDGWTWHFFVADSRGKSASITFINGEVVVNRGERMPVTALMNEPYDRELELLRYFEGFGGRYPIDLDSEHTPRFAKAAVMLRDFDPANDPVDYGFLVLEELTVSETPKWSVVFDVPGQMAYFKTRLNPEIKSFSLRNIDFSNAEDVQILNIDITEGGDVTSLFHAYYDEEIYDFLMALPIPDEFFTVGGLTREEYSLWSTEHWHEAERVERQTFNGRWTQIDSPGRERQDAERWVVEFDTRGNRVEGTISRPSLSIDAVPIDHLRSVDNRLTFTFRRAPGGEIFEIQATVRDDRMEAHLLGIEDDYGVLRFQRED